MEPLAGSALRGTHTGPGRGRTLLRRATLLGGIVGAACGVVVACNPHAVATAFGGFEVTMLLPAVALVAAFHALQGLRWHLLLRAAGVRSRHMHTQLINVAGQAVASVLPCGDLMRATLISRSSGVSFGTAAATVTVQELAFMTLLVVVAAPPLIQLPGGPMFVATAVTVVGAIAAVLTVPMVYRTVRQLVLRIPAGRRRVHELDSLQAAVAGLISGRVMLTGAGLDLARIAASAAVLWVVLLGFGAQPPSAWDLVLIVAVSFVGGALSLLPGGIGANEAAVSGMLIVFGIHPAVAVAAALTQRLVVTGVPALGGGIAYTLLRRCGGLQRESSRANVRCHPSWYAGLHGDHAFRRAGRAAA